MLKMCVWAVEGGSVRVWASCGSGVWVGAGVGACGCGWGGGVITVATSRFGRPPIPTTGRCGADDECSSPTDARKSFVASECERAIRASERISR